MQRCFWVVAAAFVLSITPAAAQSQANVVVEHYQAYTAAIERGDLAAAEVAAAAALDASIARDGEGGSTAALLTNLVQTRLQLNLFAEALEPARRLMALVEAPRGEAPIDALTARVYLGMAELSLPGDNAGDRLTATLPELRANTEFRVLGAAAAQDLAEWHAARSRHAQAVEMWTTMLGFIPNEELETMSLRIQWFMGRGASYLILDSMDFRGNPEIGTNIERRPDGLAERDFTEALRLVLPYARNPADGSLTEPQMLYARALAWHGALRARLRTFGWRPPATGNEYGALTIDIDQADNTRVCAMEIDASPIPRYPAAALERYGVGVVVLRVVTDANGAITDIRPVASVGGQQFVDAVAAVAPRWRIERGEEYEEPCSKRAVRLVPVLFQVR
jgi:hypothetical protein